MIRLLLLAFVFISLNSFAQGYICAVGGGSEAVNDWNRKPYQWIVDKADSGKIIVISFNNETNWIPDYFVSLGASSSFNLRINSRTQADLQSTYDELKTAKGIFFKGGDQYNYISTYKGTKTEQAIVEIFQAGGVIAGTSAGAMILGEIDFTARVTSISSKEALQNPFSSAVDLDFNFMNLVPNTLFDTHFIERGRLGRLAAMLIKTKINFNREIIGAGIDDKTAVCISPDGIAEVFGSGSVAFLRFDNNTNISATGTKFSLDNLKVDFLLEGWKYNLHSGEIVELPSGVKTFVPLFNETVLKTSFYLTGNNSVNNTTLNVGLNSFISIADVSNLLIIANQGYQNSVNSIVTYLSSRGLQTEHINLNSSSVNSIEAQNKIQSASAIIFAGDSANILSLLNNNSTLAGSAFESKINNSSVKLIFMGDAGKSSGSKFVFHTDSEPFAAYRGRMTLFNGLSVIDNSVFQPRVFENSDYFENRSSSVLWGMMRNRITLGFYLDGNDYLFFNKEFREITGIGAIPFFIVDASIATVVDSSRYRAPGYNTSRQTIGLDKVRLHISNNSTVKYNIDSKTFSSITSVESEKLNIPSGFTIFDAFPNPFNFETNIKFGLSESGTVTISIFDILGSEIKTDFYENLNQGEHSVKIRLDNFPAGIYFVRITGFGFSKMIKVAYNK